MKDNNNRRLIGGYNVHYYYNSTDGFIEDGREYLMQRVGVKTECERHFGAYLRCMAYSLQKKCDSATIYLLCHSQGGLIANNVGLRLDDATAKSIQAYTFGSAKLITHRRFQRATNFVSECDGVPMFSDPFRYVDAKLHPRDDIIFLKSQTFPLIDHAWSGATYQAAITELTGYINQLGSN